MTDGRPLVEYCTEPMPVRFCWMAVGEADVFDYPILAVGVQLKTHDFNGLKIKQQHVVMIEAGTNSDPRIVRHDLCPGNARILARRLYEFADAADKMNAS